MPADEDALWQELVAKPEGGLIAPQLRQIEMGIEVVGGADRLLLVGDPGLRVEGGRISGTSTLHAGQSLAFSLQHRRSVDPPRAPLDPRALLEDTIAGWQSWNEMHHKYDVPYRVLVKRSVLTLQALTYRPTGAVVAAPTTSLPERSACGVPGFQRCRLRHRRHVRDGRRADADGRAGSLT